MTLRYIAWLRSARLDASLGGGRPETGADRAWLNDDHLGVRDNQDESWLGRNQAHLTGLAGRLMPP